MRTTPALLFGIARMAGVVEDAAREVKDKTRKQGPLIQGDNMPGAIVKVTSKLARAKINVTAVVSTGAGVSVPDVLPGCLRRMAVEGRVFSRFPLQRTPRSTVE